MRRICYLLLVGALLVLSGCGSAGVAVRSQAVASSSVYVPEVKPSGVELKVDKVEIRGADVLVFATFTNHMGKEVMPGDMQRVEAYQNGERLKYSGRDNKEIDGHKYCTMKVKDGETVKTYWQYSKLDDSEVELKIEDISR